MHCTNCGAEIPNGAKFCPSCGAAAGGEAASTKADTKATPAHGAMGKGCAFLALIVVAFGLIGMCSRDNATDRAARNVINSEPPLRVTAQELFRAYQANEAAAQQQYGERPLEVSGTVDGVDLNLTDEPVVKLQTDNQFMSAQASLADEVQSKASSLAKGQQIVLSCEGVTEVIGIPMLSNCRF